MSLSTSTERPLSKLTREIEELKVEVARLEGERRSAAKLVHDASRWNRYLWLARLIRRPAASFNLWHVGALLVGPAVVGILTFVLIDQLTNSYRAAVIAILPGIVVGAGAFGILLYYPADALLSAATIEAEIHFRAVTARYKERMAQLSEAKDRLKKHIKERHEFVVSGKAQRAALLELNWKSMSGYDWEHYLIRVCEALGGIVEHTGKCGDQGCDLIVQFATNRIAVQAKGYDERNPVNNKAVQEAYTGMAFHSCDACAVITNTRFRKSARTVAAKTGCILIGRNEFPDFVMGKIQLHQIPNVQC